MKSLLVTIGLSAAILAFAAVMAAPSHDEAAEGLGTKVVNVALSDAEDEPLVEDRFFGLFGNLFNQNTNPAVPNGCRVGFGTNCANVCRACCTAPGAVNCNCTQSTFFGGSALATYPCAQFG